MEVPEVRCLYYSLYILSVYEVEEIDLSVISPTAKPSRQSEIGLIQLLI